MGLIQNSLLFLIVYIFFIKVKRLVKITIEVEASVRRRPFIFSKIIKGIYNRNIFTNFIGFNSDFSPLFSGVFVCK